MDSLGAYAGDLVLQAYGPLIDKIGGWLLALLAVSLIGRFAIKWWEKL